MKLDTWIAMALLALAAGLGACGKSDGLRAKITTTPDLARKKAEAQEVEGADHNGMRVAILESPAANEAGNASILLAAIRQALEAKPKAVRQGASLLVVDFEGNYRRNGPPPRASALMKTRCQLIDKATGKVQEAFRIEVKTDSISLEGDESAKLTWVWQQANASLAREIVKNL